MSIRMHDQDSAPPRAAIYARVSSEEQTKGFSLPTQLAAMRDYAAAHGFVITYEFSEDYSGMKLDRPELTHIRQLAVHGAIDVLIVYTSDRLTRNPAHGLILRDELSSAGVVLHFVTDGAVATTPEGEARAGREDHFNHYWWSKLREGAIRGRRGKAEAGIIPGSGMLPYGYTKEGKRREMRLVTVPEEAEIVRSIFHWFIVENLTAKQIAERLTALAVPTPAGAHNKEQGALTPWGYNSVRILLRQEIYAGVAYAYKYRRTSKGSSVLRPREEWLPIAVPVIVERQLWEAAQRKLDEGRRTYIRPPRFEYLIAKRVTCVCGYHASARPGYFKGITYLYYHCNNSSRPRDNRCNMPRFRADQVDPLVWAWVQQQIADPDHLRATYQAMQHAQTQQQTSLVEQRIALERQIEKHQAKQRELLDLYLESSFPRTLLDAKRREIEDALTALMAEHNAVLAQLEPLLLSDAQIATVMQLAQEIHAASGPITFAVQRRLVEALDLQVTLAVEEGVKVIYIHWCQQTECIDLHSSVRSNAERPVGQ